MKKEDLDQHRLLVLNHIDTLFSRHEFFLTKVIECCLQLKNNWGTQQDDTIYLINHYFDAYLNTFQSLKDSLQIALKRDLTWSEFDSIPYSKFIKNSRNASTHDGFSIINLVSNGKFYISSDITRVYKDKTGYKLITIDTPEEDVLTVSVRFSQGLFLKIKQWIEEDSKRLPQYSMEDHMRSFNPDNIKVGMPEEIKQLIHDNKDDLLKTIQDNRDELIRYKSKRRDDGIQSILNICNKHLLSHLK